MFSFEFEMFSFMGKNNQTMLFFLKLSTINYSSLNLPRNLIGRHLSVWNPSAELGSLILVNHPETIILAYINLQCIYLWAEKLNNK